MKPRVAVVHQQLLPGGGSEVGAMWTLQALADEYRATLITMGRPDIAALNRSCGTAVDEGRIEVRALPIPPGLRRRFDALRGVRLDRYCRRHAGEFDVMVSAYNVMDFGRPGIQIVADFSFDDDLRREVHAGSGAADGALYAASAGRSFYMALAKALSGRSEERLGEEPHPGRLRMGAGAAQRQVRCRFDGPLSARLGRPSPDPLGGP